MSMCCTINNKVFTHLVPYITLYGGSAGGFSDNARQICLAARRGGGTCMPCGAVTQHSKLCTEYERGKATAEEKD